jgi:hypothetical protein
MEHAAFTSVIHTAVKKRASSTIDVLAGDWQDRNWESVPARLDTQSHRASAEIPAGTKALHINLFDDDGLVVSLEHK